MASDTDGRYSPKIDLYIEDHGTITLVRPYTEAAREWFDAHIGDDAQWMGDALAVEPRYLGALIAGAFNDGLTIEHETAGILVGIGDN